MVVWSGAEWWTLIVVAIGTFMSALDGSVVNTALPVIGRETGRRSATLNGSFLCTC